MRRNAAQSRGTVLYCISVGLPQRHHRRPVHGTDLNAENPGKSISNALLYPESESRDYQSGTARRSAEHSLPVA